MFYKENQHLIIEQKKDLRKNAMCDIVKIRIDILPDGNE